MKREIIVKKEKSTAVVLAIFFGVFAWIYTWKFDKHKFWVGLIVGILLGWTFVVPIGIWIWVIINMATKDQDKFDNYHKWKIK